VPHPSFRQQHCNSLSVVMAYTLPEDIRPGSRKSALCQQRKAYGEKAMYKLNTLFKHPIKDTTLLVWQSNWRVLKKKKKKKKKKKGV
jgi:hypothetical protein